MAEAMNRLPWKEITSCCAVGIFCFVLGLLVGAMVI